VVHRYRLALVAACCWLSVPFCSKFAPVTIRLTTGSPEFLCLALARKRRLSVALPYVPYLYVVKTTSAERPGENVRLPRCCRRALLRTSLSTGVIFISINRYVRINFTAIINIV